MRQLVLLFTALILSMTASAGIFDNLGKDLSIAFGQCSKDKQARVEAVLNNKDLTKATVISDGQRPFKLYTKNNKKGLLMLCKRDAPNLAINQVLSGLRSSFYCGNKVYTCNVVTISTSSGGGDHDNDRPIVIPPPKDKDGDDITPPTGGGDDDDDTTPPTGGGDDGDDTTPPTGGGDDGDNTTPPTGGGDDGDDTTPPTGGGDDDDNTTPPTGGGDTANPVEDL